MPVRLTDERLAHILEHPENQRAGSKREATTRRGFTIVSMLASPWTRVLVRGGQGSAGEVDADGNILGFSIMKVSALKGKPFEVALALKAPGASLRDSPARSSPPVRMR